MAACGESTYINLIGEPWFWISWAGIRYLESFHHLVREKASIWRCWASIEQFIWYLSYISNWTQWNFFYWDTASWFWSSVRKSGFEVPNNVPYQERTCLVSYTHYYATKHWLILLTSALVLTVPVFCFSFFWKGRAKGSWLFQMEWTDSRMKYLRSNLHFLVSSFLSCVPYTRPI